MNSTSKERAAGLPAEGSAQQRIRNCSRRAHENVGYDDIRLIVIQNTAAATSCSPAIMANALA